MLPLLLHMASHLCIWLLLSCVSAGRCSSGALELAVWKLRLGLLQAVLLLLVLPVVDDLCRLVQQQHLVPAYAAPGYRTQKTHMLPPCAGSAILTLHTVL